MQNPKRWLIDVIGLSIRVGIESMKNDREKRELLPLRRMAAQVGVPSSWLKEQAEAGKIPGLRAGNRWLFVPATVTDALKAMAGDPRPQLLAPKSKGGEQ